MTVSQNGQVSIPAATRKRWDTKKVVVVDMGGYLVVKPVGDDPIGELQGVLKNYAGPSTDEMRREARAEDARRERKQAPRRRAAS